MKIIFMTLLILSSIFAKDNKTELEKYMDFNTSYYTVQEYKKKFSVQLLGTDILGAINAEDFALLTKKKITDKSSYRHKKIHLSKNYLTILNAIEDKEYKKYMFNKDKTSKLSEVIYNTKRALVTYPGGDKKCLWSNIYLISLHKNIIDIYEIDGFSAMYAPLHHKSIK